MLVDTIHTVEAGDTLSKIASEYNISVTEIVELNGIENPNMIYIGETLIIIPSDEVVVEETEYKLVDQSTNAYDLTEDEKNLLAQLVYSEANDQSMEGREAVVHVVLNRMDDANFPNTVTEIIMEKGQFDNSSIVPTYPVTDENKQAVENALTSPDNTNGALYFWDPTLSDSAYMKTLKVVKVIGDHEFCIEG